MKLRESIQRYSVGKHGSEYIDYHGPAMVCPECQSDNVREIEPYKGDRNGDYLCEDCGCEFDTWIGTELTGFGKFMDRFTKAMVVIFVVLGAACFVSGAVYLFHLEKIYGYGDVPSNLTNIGLAIAAGGLVLFLILAGVVYAINEKI